MPPLRGTAFIAKMTAAAKPIGWHPFPRPCRDQLAVVPESLGLSVPRLLQPGRLPRGRQELDGGDDDSARAGHGPSAGRHARARHDDRGRPAHGRMTGVTYVTDGIGALPAGESRPGRELHLREHPAAAALEVEGVPERTLEQPRAGRAPLLQPSPRRAGVGVVFRSISTAGLVCRRRASRSTTGPTTTSITRASTSSAAAISGRCRTSGRSRPPVHEHFRPRAPLGDRSGRRSSKGERRPLAQLVHPEDDSLPYEDPNYLGSPIRW